MTRASLTLKSGNAKTGPIPISITEAASCPASCPFKGAGCYAENWPLRLHWERVAASGDDWATFTAKVAALPAGTLWRHNVAGDLPGTGERIDGRALAKLVKANAGKRGFTYTHKSPHIPANAKAIAKANAAGFTINLSANNLSHADQLAALGIAPVVVTLPAGIEPGDNYQTTPQGRRVVVCPATYLSDVTCASCKLCAYQPPARLGGPAQRVIVGFPAHGARKKHVSKISEGKQP